MAMHLVAREPGRHRLIGDHVGENVLRQSRFCLEHDINRDAERGATIGVGKLVFGGTQIRALTSACPPWAYLESHWRWMFGI
jgi:hypothetical protein